MPGVSVIIPTYNCSALVKEAIESVLQQSYADYEVIVVDDGSTDDTRSVVKQISDHRIRYFYKANGGQSSAQNLGIVKATGKYIAYLDSDDIWPPDYLKTVVNELDAKEGYGATYARVLILYPDGTKKEMSKTEVCKSGWITKYFFETYPGLMPSATCFRKSACDGVFWDEALKRTPDYDFFLRISTKVRFLYVPDTYVTKRWLPQNLSSSKDPINYIEKAYILERFFFRLDGKKYVSLRCLNRKISRNYRKAGKISTALGNRHAALLLFKKAISYYPVDLRLYINLIKALLKNIWSETIPDWQMPEPLPPHITVPQESGIG